MSKYKNSVRSALIEFYGNREFNAGEAKLYRMLTKKSEKRWKPRMDERYYVPNPTSIYLANSYAWTNNQMDRLWLKQHLVFKIKKEAITCAVKMLEVIKPTK